MEVNKGGICFRRRYGDLCKGSERLYSRENNEALLAKGVSFRYAEGEVRAMNKEETGALLRKLRAERGLSQKQAAETLSVSPQAVSKWETGQGLPDVTLLSALAELYGVSMERLLSGSLSPELPEVGNMKRLKFYVCPGCGNVLTAAGGCEVHCCGRKIEPLAAREADEEHEVFVQEIEEDWYVTFSHPMEKGHYFRFAACVTADKLLLVRLYPEQGGEFRIPQIRGGGKLYLCCSRDGLFEVKL